ncbi:Transmembrane amino acid transporter [Blattamonas nauphoetae]|uniref:Transmembrane amino acid transporter n=1 Tax=Blattamonas nauphoetae TaxID=2049346 RepID=A0ABQ9YE61_9EUKA|nr:Transmembrane amino acid transporter [Blattamonas nauphoetae]
MSEPPLADPVIAVVPKTKSRKKESNLVSGSMNLVNMVIGSGTLGLPFAFAKAGLVPAILMFVVFGLLSYLTFYYCMYASDVTMTYTFGDIGARLYGPIGLMLVSLTVFIKCFCVLWSYSVLAGDFIISFLRAFGVPPGNFFLNRWFIAILIGFFVLQPLSWFRRVESLSVANTFACFIMVYAVFVVIFRMFLPNTVVVHDKPEAFHSSLTIFQCFSTLSFAFGCHQSIPILQGEIKQKSMKLMIKISITGYSIVAAIYFFCAIFGYLQFTNTFFSANSPGNILNLYGDTDILALIARIGVLLVVVLSYPLLMLPTRSSLYSMIRVVYDLAKKDKATPVRKMYGNGAPPPLIPKHWKEIKLCCGLTKHHIATGITGTIITFFTSLLACFLYQVALVFDINGSTAGCAVAFIIPPLFYIRCKTRPDVAVNLDRKRIILNIPLGEPVPGEEPEEEWEDYETETEVSDNEDDEGKQAPPAVIPNEDSLPSEFGDDDKNPNAIPQSEQTNDVEINPIEESDDHKPQKRTKTVRVTRRRRIFRQPVAPRRVHQIDSDGQISGLSPGHETSVQPTQSRMGLLAAQSPAMTPAPSYGMAATPTPDDNVRMSIELTEYSTPARQSTDDAQVVSHALSSPVSSERGIEPSPTPPERNYRSNQNNFTLPDNPADDDLYQKYIRKYLVVHKKSHPKIIIAYLVLIVGVVLGLVSLAMAIIYDTDIKNNIPF